MPAVDGTGHATTAPSLAVMRRLLSNLERRLAAGDSDEFIKFDELPLLAQCLTSGPAEGKLAIFRQQLQTKLHQYFRRRWPSAAADWTASELARGQDRGVGNRALGKAGLDLRAIAVPYINAAAVPALWPAPLDYVATQHPMSSTVGDFWRMVLLLQPSVIVMLNGAEALKDAQTYPAYWAQNEADEGESASSTGPTVTEVRKRHDTSADAAVRTLRCNLHGLEWQGAHVLVQWWRDQHAPPEDRFLSLLRLLNRCVHDRGPRPPPVLAHCAGGIGRTGLLIATDCGARAAAAPGGDPSNCSPDKLVAHLRRCRMNMVQTAEQYECLHLALPGATAQLKASAPSSEWLRGGLDEDILRRTRSV